MEDFKIYFIYLQKGNKSNIEKINLNKLIKKIEEVAKGQTKEYIYTLYCITINNNNDKNQITLEFVDNQGELYIANINSNNPEIFQYNIIFESYFNKSESSLDQIILPSNIQFNIFKSNLKNIDKKILSNLYLSRLNFILLNYNNDIDFESLLSFFIEIYKESKNSSELKIVLKNFLEKFDLKVLNNNKKNKDLEIKEKDLEILSDYNKLRDDLTLITNNKEEINEKIDVFLGYYYLFYKPKIFIYYISNKKNSNDIIKHLSSNRNYFNEFSVEVINFGIMDEAEDLFQVLSLMSLLPNMVDCFKIISNYTFYLKLSSICQIEAKTLDLIRINKPQKNDNMELLFN